MTKITRSQIRLGAARMIMTGSVLVFLFGSVFPAGAAQQTQATSAAKNQAFTDQIFFKAPAKPKWPTVKQLFTLDKDLEPFEAAWQQDKAKKVTGLTVKVKNKKDGATLGFTIGVKFIGAKGSVTIFDVEDEGLDGGEEGDYEVALTNQSVTKIGAIVSAEVVADSANKVKETNEQNNKIIIKAAAEQKKAEDEAATISKVTALAKLLQPPAKAALPLAQPPAKPVEFVPAESKPMPPNKPTLKEPADGGSVTTVTPVLNWTDNGPGKNYFRWYVLNPDSNQRVWERDWEKGETVDRLCTNALNQWICQYATVPPGKLSFDQSYKWTVEANDGKMNSGYASSSQFNVKYEFVPVQFKAAPPAAATTNQSCSGHQVLSGGTCVCPDGLFESPAPYCCPINRYWDGAQCQIVG